MAYFIPLLLYLGFGGGVLLLGVGSFPTLRPLRKPLSAAWVTMLTLVWMLVPQTGRWVLSAWTPSSVSGGWMLLDLNPGLWWCGLGIGLVLAGVLWVSVAEHSVPVVLTGSLLVISLVIVWLALAGGSLLMTLAMWAVFDIIWFVARLISNADDEGVVWASAIHGAATIIMWTVSLFLIRQGASGLWWLMRPADSLFTLMVVASILRLGFYPFQIVHADVPGPSRSLSVIGALSPILGIALLYRLMALPVEMAPPTWVLAWGCLSVFWSGVKAFSSRERHALLTATYGVLLMLVTGALARGDARLLVTGAGVWLASMALLLVARRYDVHHPLWWLPTAVALVALMGAPPSPLGDLYRHALQVIPWVWRLLFLLGSILIAATLLQNIAVPAKGRVPPPIVHRQIALVIGFVLLVGALTALTGVSGGTTVAAISFALWSVGLVLGTVLSRWGQPVRALAQQGRAWIELLDLQWFYRALWQGAEHLLGVVRVGAEVVEGSGSVLWSVLVLLLVVMVLSSR